MVSFPLLLLFSLFAAALSGESSRLARRESPMKKRSPAELNEHLNEIGKMFIMEYLDATLPSMVAYPVDLVRDTAIQVLNSIVSVIEEVRDGTNTSSPRTKLRSKLAAVPVLRGQSQHLFRPIDVLVRTIEAIVEDKDIFWAKMQIEIMEFLDAKSGKDAIIAAFDNAVWENQLVFQLQ